MYNDITERKQSEQALRESEARFRNMADNAPVMVWITDADGQCTYLSTSGYAFTGQTPATGLGLGWLGATHPNDRKHSEQIFVDANAHQAPFRLEYRLRRSDGAYRWAIDSAVPRWGDTGEFLGYIGSVIDIEERKQAEEDLVQAYAAEMAARVEAEAALQTRDQFLSIASHELRTPLTSLLGYASLLRTAAARGTGDVNKMAERITRQAERLNGLIELLLDVSRLQRGQFTIERRPLDLAALVGDVVNEVRATLPLYTTHTIDLICANDPIVVLGDAHRLEEVLQNLLNNAVKYSPQGGPVHVRLRRAGMEAVLEIADQGIGVPAEAEAQLFEPFYRAANVGAQTSGFGLGLHIVREIVQRHGGRIGVESTEGEGSTFRVVLPLRSREGARARNATFIPD